MSHATTPPVAASRPLPARVLDVAVPVAILLAVLVVLAPVPAGVVDLLLAANLTVSVLAVLGALAARTPLEMSVFPTFLLGSTLVRLVLNIATTRLILARAALDGPDAAGEVVQAFGAFVAANNIVVGGVIFAIIAIIQFVVITAGSTRTSEVAARFALDGLPGRQMAIDTEVQAGTVTREQARQLRLDLQRQADFFASMDGASRFVRGEAVAGVVITLVNLIGGLAIGVVQHGMPVGKAVDVYSRLTIGDGLASAVPALLVSVATGLLISRTSQSVDLSAEFGRQFAARPQVLAITAAFLAILSLTDLPFLPLAGMATAVAVTAWFVARGARRDAAAAAADAASAPAGTSRGTRANPPALDDERLVVEVGRGLVGLLAGQSARLPDLATALRDAVAADLGVIVPPVAMRDDLSLPERGYRVLVAGDVVFEEEIPAGKRFVVPPLGEVAEPVERPGDAGHSAGTDPLTGRRGQWLGHAAADAAGGRGALVSDPADRMARALEAAVRLRADRLLTRDAVARLVESLRAAQPAVVDSIVPGVLTVARIQRTLQCLLREGMPIRPLAELLEIMADHAADAVEPADLADVVRRPLVRSVCRQARDPRGRLVTVRLDDAAAEEVAAPRGRPPARLVADLRRATRPAVERGAKPVVVVPAALRRRIREALARPLPDLVVLAAEELADEDKVEVFATVGGDATLRAA